MFGIILEPIERIVSGNPGEEGVKESVLWPDPIFSHLPDGPLPVIAVQGQASFPRDGRLCRIRSAHLGQLRDPVRRRLAASIRAVCNPALRCLEIGPRCSLPAEDFSAAVRPGRRPFWRRR